MKELIIRNDDVSVDTDLIHFDNFCKLCDKYGVQIIQAITPIGKTHGIKKEWTNKQILDYSLGDHCANILDNDTLSKYLMSRAQLSSDKPAVHGLFHTHNVTTSEQAMAASILRDMFMINELAAVWPFNEEGERFDKLLYIENVDRLEDYLPGMPKENKIPETDIVYLHSWRFDGSWYTLGQLEECFKRLLDK